MNRPLLIVLTPVRNEAWILKAFLKAASLWADYVIIADQMSTDGSREIYKQFDKVIVVDNTNPEMHQAHARKLLFDEAAKIQGDKILFALDADEFISGNLSTSTEWQDILKSEPGDCFCLLWHNVLPNLNHYVIPGHTHFYWIYHMKGDMLQGEFPENYIHEWRLPWPSGDKYNRTFNLNELYFIHLGITNKERQQNKKRFYQTSTLLKEPCKSTVSFFRMYNSYKKEKDVYKIEADMFAYYEENGVHILDEVDFLDRGEHYIKVVLKHIKEKGIEYFSKLDIWDSCFLKEYNLKDPRAWSMKLLHFYLRNTRKIEKTYLVRAIDKALKKIYK